MAVQLTQTVKAEQFYPTPPALIDRMLNKINMERCETFLEPEAGKGDIAEQILRRLNRERRYRGMKDVSIDCVEIDAYGDMQPEEKAVANTILPRSVRQNDL